MVLPVRSPFAWALGTPEDRNIGGLVGLIWADSLLPYSVNPPTVPVPDDPPPDPPDPEKWWTQPPPVHGQFEGWVRNFLANSGTGAPNFPNSRHLGPEDNRIFNCVIPFMLGLTVSQNAPRRVQNVVKDAEGNYSLQLNESDGPNSLNPEKVQWPFGANDKLAINFILFYLENFVDPTSTSVIIALPVREVMNYIGATADPSLQPSPDPVAGAAGLTAFIETVLDKAKELGITILGWYLIDEPDIFSFNYWAPAKKIGTLRQFVRLAEHDWRIASPGGVPNDLNYANLGTNQQEPGPEQQKRLRPCILTFSRAFGDAGALIDPPPGITRREQPAEYVAAKAADLYFFDWYPFRRTIQDVKNDWDTCDSPPNLDHFRDFPPFNFGDVVTHSNDLKTEPMSPKPSLRRFRYIRYSLNNATGGATLPDNVNYVPVMLWSQGDGAVNNRFHESTETEGTPDLSPSVMPRPSQISLGGEGCIQPNRFDEDVEPLFRRTKLMPTADDVRDYMWEGLHEWSEGFACFSQIQIADRMIVDRFVPAARELAYFQSWRWNGINTTPNFVPKALRDIKQDTLPVFDIPPASPARPYVFSFFRFRDPVGSLPGLTPEDDRIPPEQALDWLLVMNRDNSILHVNFSISRAKGFPAGTHQLEERRFLERVPGEGSIITIDESVTPNVSFDLQPFTMKLFRLRPFQAP